MQEEELRRCFLPFLFNIASFFMKLMILELAKNSNPQLIHSRDILITISVAQ
jgi:hypothetical protein